jgi:undecaprenyl diphosphate synthase
MEATKDIVDKSNLPNHIAVIMDGNGRWAKKKGAKRIFGHQNAIKAVRDVYQRVLQSWVSDILHYMHFQRKTGSAQKLK